MKPLTTRDTLYLQSPPKGGRSLFSVNSHTISGKMPFQLSCPPGQCSVGKPLPPNAIHAKQRRVIRDRDVLSFPVKWLYDEGRGRDWYSDKD